VKYDPRRLEVDRESSTGKRLFDLNLWTHDLENFTSLWSDCKKY